MVTQEADLRLTRDDAKRLRAILADAVALESEIIAILEKAGLSDIAKARVLNTLANKMAFKALGGNGSTSLGPIASDTGTRPASTPQP